MAWPPEVHKKYQAQPHRSIIYFLLGLHEEFSTLIQSNLHADSLEKSLYNTPIPAHSPLRQMDLPPVILDVPGDEVAQLECYTAVGTVNYDHQVVVNRVTVPLQYLIKCQGPIFLPLQDGPRPGRKVHPYTSLHRFFHDWPVDLRQAPYPISVSAPAVRAVSALVSRYVSELVEMPDVTVSKEIHGDLRFDCEPVEELWSIRRRPN
mmetsp:Transcript_19885/g.41513  ORF Transcript_19885/g.41513 Transcript_19885/m.41513 type:complete len:206 (-) Transcript_19885:3279-3896(-)